MSQLIYLSCPFGGDPKNLQRAIANLAWAHTHTNWGLWVQAPWIASAMAEVQRGTTVEQWREMGGIDVEERIMCAFGGVLHMGLPLIDVLGAISPGMRREGRYMARTLRGRVWHVVGDGVIETTGHYR